MSESGVTQLDRDAGFPHPCRFCGFAWSVHRAGPADQLCPGTRDGKLWPMSWNVAPGTHYQAREPFDGGTPYCTCNAFDGGCEDRKVGIDRGPLRFLRQSLCKEFRPPRPCTEQPCRSLAITTRGLCASHLQKAWDKSEASNAKGAG